MINDILNSGIEFSVSKAHKLVFKGKRKLIRHWLPVIKAWRLELKKIVAGEAVSAVGNCDICNVDLIGLPVSFDGFTNRVCGACGKWHRCMPPIEHESESSCATESQSVLLKWPPIVAGPATVLPN